jgi:catechol 2,3-dioxygenase-like lactoylglutathione lyase family enzyme
MRTPKLITACDIAELAQPIVERHSLRVEPEPRYAVVKITARAACFELFCDDDRAVEHDLPVPQGTYVLLPARPRVQLPLARLHGRKAEATPIGDRLTEANLNSLFEIPIHALPAELHHSSSASTTPLGATRRSGSGLFARRCSRTTSSPTTTETRSGRAAGCTSPTGRVDARPNSEVVPPDMFDVYFWVDDVDDLYAELTERGAELVHGPVAQGYGLREFRVRDPDGYILAFGRRLNS